MDSPLIVVLLLALLAGLALALHKIRRVHQMVFRLLDDTQAIRRETDTLYAQLQAAAALRDLLQPGDPLPPMRGWAGSPDFLLAVAEDIRRNAPDTVLECSSGVSTVVVARALQQRGRGHVWSLEHDERFAHKTRQWLAERGLQDWATVLHAPLRADGGGTPWYDDRVLPADLPPVQLLLVDGPPESTAPLAREPAFQRLRQRLAGGARIFVDDGGRPDETAMVRHWQQAEPQIQVESLHTEKGLHVVTLPH